MFCPHSPTIPTNSYPGFYSIYNYNGCFWMLVGRFFDTGPYRNRNFPPGSAWVVIQFAVFLGNRSRYLWLISRLRWIMYGASFHGGDRWRRLVVCRWRRLVDRLISLRWVGLRQRLVYNYVSVLFDWRMCMDEVVIWFYMWECAIHLFTYVIGFKRWCSGNLSFGKFWRRGKSDALECFFSLVCFKNGKLVLLCMKLF